MLIDCVSIAQKIKDEIKAKVSTQDNPIELAVIQVGNDPASTSYIKGKKKDCEEVGMDCLHIKLEENVSEKEVIDVINDLNHDEDVYGIIVQLPLPKHISNSICRYIDESKNVDGFYNSEKFIPCTPKGIMTILHSLNVNLEGKNCVVIGRSNIVGKPTANLLIEAGATVAVCNSKTKNLLQFTRNADVVISATGKRNLVSPHMVNGNCIIIDVGISRNHEGKLCGDVSRDLYNTTNLVTPVPKGVGLLTRACLIENLWNAYELKRG